MDCKSHCPADIRVETELEFGKAVEGIARMRMEWFEVQTGYAGPSGCGDQDGYGINHAT